MDLNLVVVSGQLADVRVVSATETRSARVVLTIYTQKGSEGSWTEVWTLLTADLMTSLMDWNEKTRIWCAGEASTKDGNTRIWVADDGIQLRFS